MEVIEAWLVDCPVRKMSCVLWFFLRREFGGERGIGFGVRAAHFLIDQSVSMVPGWFLVGSWSFQLLSYFLINYNVSSKKQGKVLLTSYSRPHVHASLAGVA